MVVIELHFVVVLTLQSGEVGLYLLMMWLFQPLLCYFNQSLNFIFVHTSVASVAIYTDKLASVF